MTKARDRVIQHLKERIRFYEGRGEEYDLLVSELKGIYLKMETETKW